MFIWPWALALLVLLPPLVWIYLRGLPKPARAAAIHPDLALLARAQGRPHPVRRHLPSALYLGAVGLALLAVSRPQAAVPLPDDRTAIMLVLDVSRSMRAQDIEPSRFVAAQQAARSFVKSLPAGTRVGLASFAGSSLLNAPPTSRHEQVLAAIDGLTLGSSTAIGDGLLEALNALVDGTARAPTADQKPAAAIVLLSDGRNNSGVDPLQAASRVKTSGIKVYTVGLGTAGESLRSDRWNPPGRSLDAATLQQIATTTGGRYYEARSASQLSSVYREMGRSLAWKMEWREVSGIVGALAGLLLLGSLGLSQRYTRRLQ
ncbi:VWA domain-containing protein [Deinococcus sp. KSM4-11]|uniref:vWA domain-containing protein n=1 Tax=Deinococcus sp. KSM4-11 TaxID=2568654 RepID=UPI0010A5396A|nr:VWA domain-containing protein [Deinococcus sp. KSM4-11]THF86882.1 VWA domain-containing protein [Deinococcus sp. KSM4-11]